MGTQQAYPIGTILTRKKKQEDDLDELVVVGGGKQLVVTSHNGFSGNFQLDAAAARAEYTSDVPDTVYLEQPGYVSPGLTPEQQFAEAAERNPPEENESRGRTRRTNTPKKVKPVKDDTDA